MPMQLMAVAQMSSTEKKAENVATATALIREAAGLGAVWVGLPENFSWIGAKDARADAAEALEGPTLSRMAELAKEHRITVLAGSILESGAPDGRLYNTSVLFGPDGERLAVYRKIHLFDVDLPDGTTYRESSSVAPGSEVVVAPTVLGPMGLSICYDLRFPELYRKQAEMGATLLAVPSAFTLTTGRDHWEVLLCARAIENQAWVLAPAQWGRHSANRQTFGHALIVDAWGLVVARASDGVGLCVAPHRPEVTERFRSQFPALRHRKLD